jgi:hypothetical protein
VISLFIDANVYLRFYAYTDDDLIELEKLQALVEAGQLRIYKNCHLEDEIERNRENKIVAALDTFKKSAASAQIPRFALHFEEAQKLLELSKSVQKAKSELTKKISEEIGTGELRADNLIRQLLEKGEDLAVDNKILENARWRQIRGNPPGKSDSIGDQIHWETLLSSAEEGEDLHIVSLDGDFSSARDSSAANPKLVSEWKAKTGGALHVYGSLSQFAKSHFGNISLPSDVKKSSAISKLVTTTNFENTHKQISNLEEVFDEITVEEALIIFQAMIDNNQIYWISDDQDVMNFYKKLHGKFLFETTVEMDKQLYEKAKYLDTSPF